MPLKRLGRICVSTCRERFENPLFPQKIGSTNSRERERKEKERKKERNADIFKYFSNWFPCAFSSLVDIYGIIWSRTKQRYIATQVYSHKVNLSFDGTQNGCLVAFPAKHTQLSWYILCVYERFKNVLVYVIEPNAEERKKHAWLTREGMIRWYVWEWPGVQGRAKFFFFIHTYSVAFIHDFDAFSLCVHVRSSQISTLPIVATETVISCNRVQRRFNFTRTCENVSSTSHRAYLRQSFPA